MSFALWCRLWFPWVTPREKSIQYFEIRLIVRVVLIVFREGRIWLQCTRIMQQVYWQQLRNYCLFIDLLISFTKYKKRLKLKQFSLNWNQQKPLALTACKTSCSKSCQKGQSCSWWKFSMAAWKFATFRQHVSAPKLYRFSNLERIPNKRRAVDGCITRVG